MIEVKIAGNPISWKRASRNHEKTYDSQINEKSNVAWVVKSQLNGIYLTQEPLKVEFQFYVLPKKNNRTQSLEIDFSKYHRIVDVDNYVKFYFDALKGVLWNDDSHIYSLRANKYFTSKPRTIIRIGNLRNGEFDEIFKELRDES